MQDVQRGRLIITELDHTEEDEQQVLLAEEVLERKHLVLARDLARLRDGMRSGSVLVAVALRHVHPLDRMTRILKVAVSLIVVEWILDGEQLLDKVHLGALAV